MYYPNLRWKQGEVKALENAPEDWYAKMCPIWIVENPQEGLVDSVLGIVSLWSGNQILDMSRVDIETVEDELFDAVSSTPLPFAITPKSSRFLGEDLQRVFKNNPCFRVACSPSLEEVLNPETHDENLSYISDFIESQNVKVILDFGVVNSRYVADSDSLAEIVEIYLNAGVMEVIISGGSFPKTLQDIQGVEHITRFEKLLFQRLSEKVTKPISYSDYATLSPEWNQSEIMRSKHINIRYTHDDYWVVLRQPGKDKAAIYELTKILVLQSEFRGAEFSWADNVWVERAKEPPVIGPGNSTFHVSEFIHHHISQVLVCD
ncbi:MAG: hypothetical protein COB48_07760 [Pseudoalteromonas sp.]|nr:MAG: hypothetical protein COB48_07760 [Pseudoalteromonas sp.]